MKRCAICGEIVDDSVTVCPVCKATKFVPIDENAEIKFACVPAQNAFMAAKPPHGRHIRNAYLGRGCYAAAYGYLFSAFYTP